MAQPAVKKPKKIDILAHLADAFIELASKEGVYRITLEAVAKKARIPFSTAHYHLKATGLSIVEFGLQEVSAHGKAFTERYLQDAAVKNPGANPLHQYLEATFEWARLHRSYATLWLFHYHLISVSEDARRAYQPFLDQAVVRIEKILFESIGKGIYRDPTHGRDDLTIPELAFTLHSLFLGGTHRALVAGADVDRSLKRHQKVIIQTVDALLGQKSK